eukprot:TRINITY_DN22750_c0_g1_i4.p1 TRINITY_DN22750_c0_g1~~TRINITY_DN22750_c0_g1_i4.p1  ORF type:complete len:1282 (+),score=392.62 TRINITY_DN22750_c0_g1_i4:148-3993(+)
MEADEGAPPSSASARDAGKELDSIYTQFDYNRPFSVVVADGAALLDDKGRSFDLDALHECLVELPDGPRVILNPSEPSDLHGGAYWVDSAERREELEAAGVTKYFRLVLYSGNGAGQSSKVDAKVQSLLHRFAGMARREEHRYTDRATIVLLAGDGDHHPHLEAAKKSLCGTGERRSEDWKSKDVKVWIASWKSDLSAKLRIAADGVIDLASMKRVDTEGAGLSCITGVPLQDRSLRWFVKKAFPVFDKKKGHPVHALLRNPGLHSLLKCTWQALCEPRPERRENVFIVTGTTGSGKTTQIPQLLYDQMLSCRRQTTREPRILCVQPRRLACQEISKRVAHERGWKRGALPWYQDYLDDVGYMIGGVRRCTSHTPIVFCTPGMLLKQITGQSEGEWDVLIIDEVHDRSNEYDLLLSLILRPQFMQPHRILLLMSATIDRMVRDLQHMVIHRLGEWQTQPRGMVRTFDVTAPADGWAEPPFTGYDPADALKPYNVDLRYLDELEVFQQILQKIPDVEDLWRDALVQPKKNVGDPDYHIWDERIEFVAQFLAHMMHNSMAAGEEIVILAFVPAFNLMKDIQVRVSNILKNDNHVQKDDLPRICILNSQANSQEALTGRAPGEAVREGQRVDRSRLILATDTAESSITIEDVTVVVDLCLQKEAHCQHRQVEVLFLRASKAALKQRKGRAGRVCDGTCIRMITRAEYEWLREVREPQLRRSNLEKVVLDVGSLLRLREDLDPIKVISGCLDPPDPQRLQAAQNYLQQIGALAGGVRLTALGDLLQRLPLDVDMGRFVAWACLIDAEVAKLAVEVAAMESADVQLQATTPEEAYFGTIRYGQLQLRWAEGFPSDVPVVLGLLRAYRVVPVHQREAWCKERYVSYIAMRNVEPLVARVRHELHRWAPICPTLPEKLLQEVYGEYLQSQVVEALATERDPPKQSEILALMVLHAMAFADSGTYTEANPQRRHKHSFRNIVVQGRHARGQTTGFVDYFGRARQFPFRFEDPVPNQGRGNSWRVGVNTTGVTKVHGAPEGVWLLTKLDNNLHLIMGCDRRERCFMFMPPSGNMDSPLIELQVKKLQHHVKLSSGSVCVPIYGADDDTKEAHGAVFSSSRRTHEGQRNTRTELRYGNTYLSYKNPRMARLATCITHVFADPHQAVCEPSVEVTQADVGTLQRIRNTMADTFASMAIVHPDERFESENIADPYAVDPAFVIPLAPDRNIKRVCLMDDLLVWVGSVLQCPADRDNVLRVVEHFRTLHEHPVGDQGVIDAATLRLFRAVLNRL